MTGITLRLTSPEKQDQEDAPHHDAAIGHVEGGPEVECDEVHDRAVMRTEHPIRRIPEGTSDHETEHGRHRVRLARGEP